MPVSQKKNNPNQIGGGLDTVQMSKKENVRLGFYGHGTCPDSKSVNHTIFVEKYETRLHSRKGEFPKLMEWNMNMSVRRWN